MEETRPLHGVRVLDLTRVLAGPFCTLQLADLGAEVIKIEMPGRGDDSRSFGPFIGTESAYFLSLNRNKKSMTLNLKSPEGRDIMKQLVPHFDILVENFRPGTLEKLGLGYDVLSAVNPRLVYAAVSGFGATGPDTQKPAYDIVVQGRGGLMSITGEEEGGPTRVGASIGDIAAGLFTAIAILSALLVARNTGKGQKIDISMLDTQVALLENAIARYTVSGEVPQPLGNRHPSITPFSSFQAHDGYVIIAAGNDRLWTRLCHVMGVPELTDDPRFVDNDSRTQNWSELKPLLEAVIQQKPVEYWLEHLERENIPCGRIQRVDQVLQDPQITARDMIRNMVLKTGEQFTVAGIPYKFSSANCEKIVSPPILGEHTGEMLQTLLGLDKGQIERLAQKEVI